MGLNGALSERNASEHKNEEYAKKFFSTHLGLNTDCWGEQRMKPTFSGYCSSNNEKK